MAQATPIPASTEAPWSGFSSRGYSNPQPRESARRTFNSNLSGNEWGEVRRACKDQQLVCYKVSITDRTMWPQLVEIVDGLDLGLKVDGVFEKFKFGFTMKGKQGAPRDSGYGRRFFFPEETADSKLRTVMEAVDCKGDVVGFEQTRHSPEGFPYQLTFMRDYSLGSEDLVNVGVVWGLDSSYTITGYKFRGAVATRDIVESYRRQFEEDGGYDGLPVFEVARKVVPGSKLPGSKGDEWTYTLLVPDDAAGKITMAQFRPGGVGREGSFFDWEQHRLAIGALEDGGKEIGIISAKEYVARIRATGSPVKSASMLSAGANDQSVADRTILVWGLGELPDKATWTAFLWSTLKGVHDATRAEAIAKGNEPLPELAEDAIQEEVLALTGYGRPYAKILMKDEDVFEELFFATADFCNRWGPQISIRVGEILDARLHRQAVKEGRATPAGQAGMAAPGLGRDNFPSLPGGGSGQVTAAANLAATLATEHAMKEFKAFIEAQRGEMQTAVTGAVNSANAGLTKKMVAMMKQMGALEESNQALQNEMSRLQLGGAGQGMGLGRAQQQLAAMRQQSMGLDDSPPWGGMGPGGGQYVGGGASPEGVAQSGGPRGGGLQNYNGYSVMDSEVGGLVAAERKRGRPAPQADEEAELLMATHPDQAAEFLRISQNVVDAHARQQQQLQGGAAGMGLQQQQQQHQQQYLLSQQQHAAQAQPHQRPQMGQMGPSPFPMTQLLSQVQQQGDPPWR